MAEAAPPAPATTVERSGSSAAAIELGTPHAKPARLLRKSHQRQQFVKLSPQTEQTPPRCCCHPERRPRLFLVIGLGFTAVGLRLFAVASAALPQAPPVPSSRAWSTGLRATHFWDCNGAGCDAATLHPWNEALYSYSPFYAPQDPDEHGGAAYGESLWLTGAASPGLAALLGSDAACCGRDEHDEGGGCGRCLLVRNRAALRPNLTAVVMKKSHCPPGNRVCSGGKVHVDIAAPGFEYAPASLANVCGSSSRAATHLTGFEASACGCAGLPTESRRA